MDNEQHAKSPDPELSVEGGAASDAAAEADELWEQLTARREPTRMGLAVAVGAVTASVAGALWAALVTVTGYEIGYVAVGIGAVVGFAVLRVAGAGATKVAGAAAALAVVGLLVGKLLIFQFGMPARVASEVAAHPEAMSNVMYRHMAVRGEIDPEIQRWYDTSEQDAEPPEELAQEIAVLNREIDLRISQMTTSEREALVRPYAEALLENAPLSDRSPFSLFDIVWFALAIAAAWKVGSGEELISER